MNITPPDAANPLAALRPLHDPLPISIWPLAPGWWLLIILALVLIVSCTLLWLNHQRKTRYRKLAKRELARLEVSGCTYGQLNLLLKRAALVAFPQQPIASLNGRQWVEFLGSTCPSLSSDALQVLATAPYQPEQYAAMVSSVELAAAKQWINQHQQPHPDKGVVNAVA